jgi:signal transduction histidine kinase
VHAQDREQQTREFAGQALAAPLALSYRENSVVMEFLGLSFTDEEAVRYSYLLDGFEQEWSPPVAARTVRYTNLPAGHYAFKVKSCSAAGLWSEPAVMLLDINPPYWQTWWFRFAMLAAALALAYMLYAWRIRIVERRQEQQLANLRQLLESIRAINSQLDLATVLQNIAAESARLIDGEPGGIGLVSGNEVVFERLWYRDHWQNVHLAFALGEGIAGRVAANSRSMIVNNPAHEEAVVFPDLIRQFYVHGLMDVPIIDRRGKVVGVLDVRRRAGGARFTESDQKLMESLAHQAAVAIENADLYGELARQNEMIVESLRQIEHLYKNEQEVNRALQELNQMKNNFMMVTSHEMRTPLTVLKGYHEALLENYFGSLTPPQQRSLATCQRTVDRLVSTFNDILEMLKIGSGTIELKPIAVDVALAAQEVIDELKTFVERRAQHVKFEADIELPRVLADPDKLRLVLLNLVQNAIKFTPDEGEIRVRVMREQEMLHIVVEDSGIGIESKELEVIFDQFYTSPDASHHTSGQYQFEARGSGLGLAIAKSYVKAHEGKIWAESAGHGCGSSFHVLFPIAGVAVAGSAAAGLVAR